MPQNKAPISTNTVRNKKPVVEDVAEPVEPTNKVISFTDLSSILNSNSGSGYYEIYIPSQDKTYTFKQLTVGQQRSISKNSADFEQRKEQTMLRVNILKELCLDKTIEPLNFTWPEFVMCLAQIRDNNFTTPITFKLKCPDQKECQAKFDYDVDLGQIISNLEDLTRGAIESDYRFEFEMNGHTITFILNYPTVNKYVDMLEYSSKIQNQEDAENFATVAFSYAYIKNILVDGQKVVGNTFNDIRSLTNYIDTTLQFDYVKYIETLDKYFDKYTKVLEVEATCPKCKKKVPLTLDIDDFFYHS